MKILKSLLLACSLVSLPLVSSSTEHKEKPKHSKAAPKKKVKKVVKKTKKAPRHKKKAAPKKAAPKH